MKKNYTLNLAAKTLTITKAFEEAVAEGRGTEYELYQRFLQDIPGLTIIRRTHASPRKYTAKNGEQYHCNPFKNLTYKNMERFIFGLPNKEEYLRAFRFLKDNAARPQSARYPIVRRWFEAQFPEFRANPLYYYFNEVPLQKPEQFVPKDNAPN